MKTAPLSQPNGEHIICSIRGLKEEAPLNKKLFMVPLTAVMTMGLAACNTGEEEAQNRYTDSYEPLGFYSNEGHGGDERDDRDGPLTEMYDHSPIGREGQDIRQKKREYLQVKDGNGNPRNPSAPLANYDKSFLEQDGRASHGDANYHGHLDDNTRKANRSYYTAYEGDLAEKIGEVTGKVDNVSDVRAVAYGTDVLIAVELQDHSKDKEEETKARIKKAVKPYLNGRSVKVVTDEGTFSRVRNIDNDLRDGGPFEGINLDIDNMFKALKNND
jgi:spore cortex protein